MTSHKDQKQYWARENEPYSIVTVNEFAKAFQSFHEGRTLQDELAIPFDKSKSHPAALITHKYGASKKELLKACFSREFLLMKRNSFVYIFKLSQVDFKLILIFVLPFMLVLDFDISLFYVLLAYYNGSDCINTFSTNQDAP